MSTRELQNIIFVQLMRVYQHITNFLDHDLYMSSKLEAQTRLTRRDGLSFAGHDVMTQRQLSTDNLSLVTGWLDSACSS